MEDPERPVKLSRSLERIFQPKYATHRSNGSQRHSDDGRHDEFPNEDEDEAEKPKHLSWKQRMQHVTWAWFTLTMATGGIANVVHDGMACPFQYPQSAMLTSL
jgi:hypothetical protein